MEEIILLENRGSCSNPGFEVVCDGMRAYFGDHLSEAIDRIERFYKKSRGTNIRLHIYSDDISIKDQYFTGKPYFNNISVSKWSPSKFYEHRLQGAGDMGAGADEPSPSLYPVKKMIKDSFKALERIYDLHNEMPAFHIYNDLSKLVAGLKPSEVSIVTGMDKTAACIYLANLIAVESNIPLAIFSSWSNKEDLCMAMLFSIASVEHVKCINGRISESDWPKLIKALTTLSYAPIFIDDTRYVSVKDMKDEAEKLKNSKGLGLIIAGYSPTAHREEITGLKNMAKELRLPVIAPA